MGTIAIDIHDWHCTGMLGVDDNARVVFRPWTRNHRIVFPNHGKSKIGKELVDHLYHVRHCRSVADDTSDDIRLACGKHSSIGFIDVGNSL